VEVAITVEPEGVAQRAGTMCPAFASQNAISRRLIGDGRPPAIDHCLATDPVLTVEH
jgi:hypothetical protein